MSSRRPITLKYLVALPEPKGLAVWEPRGEFTYKTLSGARRRAKSLVGQNPKWERPGYASSRTREGRCVSYTGASFVELFPETCDICGTVGPVSPEPGTGYCICSKCKEKSQ